MSQCHCITAYKRDYVKYTHFWEPDEEANRDSREAVIREFSDWVRQEELSLKGKDYDKTGVRVIPNCSSSGGGTGTNCTCLFYDKVYHTDFETSLEPFDKAGGTDNFDPEPPPADYEGNEDSPYGATKLLDKCTCTKTDGGEARFTLPKEPATPKIITLQTKTFPITPKFKLTAKEVTENGCKESNAPNYMSYYKKDTEVTREKDGPEVPMKFFLKQQATPWVRAYTYKHSCP
jgi:hypothetical protein